MSNDFTCDVLIVEDERIQCEEMASFLARAGLSVVMAHDGATGLAQARRFPPRVALLDYNLPDMTGVQLAEKLRAAFPEMAIPDRLGPYRGCCCSIRLTGGRAREPQHGLAQRSERHGLVDEHRDGIGCDTASEGPKRDWGFTQ